MNKAKRIDRYLAIVHWGRERYGKGGRIVAWMGYTPAPFTRLERAAFKRYLD